MLSRTAMPWFLAPDYWLAREILERLLGAIYLFAFATVIHQFRPLLGENGLLPVPEFLRSTRFRDAPTLFRLHYSDRLAVAFGWLGGILAAAVVLGLPQLAPTPVTMLTWVVLWVLYLSVVNVGQRWYSFGWESLLLEAGFLAIFLGDDRTPPPFLIRSCCRTLMLLHKSDCVRVRSKGEESAVRTPGVVGRQIVPARGARLGVGGRRGQVAGARPIP